ncbi:DUF4287 domain-containing protein [Parasphingorhabdus sp.]|uniref:DUF4287 domain-containing protein n=1 Tax=Parasphingorhabdus sp. TaxID=2709688 RepID=UPI0032F06B57
MTSDPFASLNVALQKSTGKSLEEWKSIAKGCDLNGHMQIVGWLKSEHGLGHGHANSIAHAAKETAAISIDDDVLVANMFAGPKAALRPIYDKIIAAAKGFGDDLELSPKKAYVSLRRSKQFAIAQPSTKDRFDLGLNLKGTEINQRLELSGSWNAMVSHRVRITAPAEVDEELIGWLKAAYDLA